MSNDWFSDGKQWATGIFYRKDGQKQTLQGKPLSFSSAVIFFAALMYILASGPEAFEKEKPPLEFPETDFVTIKSLFTEKTQKSATEPKPDNTKRLRSLPGLQVVQLGTTDSTDNQVVMAKGVLTVTGSEGPVEAQVSEFVSGNHKLMKPGARLLGEARTNGDRLHVKFDQMVNRNGETFKVEAYACDLEDQALGIKGSQSWSKSLKIAAALGLNLLSGAGESFNESPTNDEDDRKTGEKILIAGASRAALEQARHLMTDVRSQNPSVQVKAGTEICLLIADHG